MDDVKEAVGGYPPIIKDGKLLPIRNDGYQEIPYSRCAIGVKDDGTVVTLTTRGRLNPISYGMNMTEVGEVLLGQGCTSGLILDCGGSATYCAKYEGENEIKTVNDPSDGKERLISSSLMFTSSAKPTGVFDHAVVTPNNLVYTPGSVVTFKAKGVDSAGSVVDLPDGATWRVTKASEAFGSIDNNGVFTSNGKCGEVNVEYVYNNEVVGKNVINIQEPDAITFTNEEISLGFNKSSDLGLVTRWKGRDVVHKDGDFEWKLVPDDDNYNPEDMGSFDGNIFTSSEGKSVNGTIHCTYKGSNGDITGSLHAIIGRLPSVEMDFEDVTLEDGTVIPAEEVWLDPEKGKIESVNYKRGAKQSLELVDINDDEEHVRFGSKSLKINYDFTNIVGTDGAGVGYKIDGIPIDGTPTAIGMWVYAPKGTPNLWLRIRVNDKDEQTQNLNFTEEASLDKQKYAGINWTGWKYVEADLTGYKAPFYLKADEGIRLMCVPGTGMGFYQQDGTKVGNHTVSPYNGTKGSIYVDNVRFVYGANVDDLDAPQAEYITINDMKLSGGETIEDNLITVKASLYDVQNSTTSGLDWDRIHTYVDNKEVAYSNNGDLLQIDKLGLANGEHKLKIVICDKFGNKTTESLEFIIKGEGNFTTISTKSSIDDEVYLNTTHKYAITTNNFEKLDTVNADFQLNKGLTNEEFKVTFNEQTDGTVAYDEETGILHLETAAKEAADLTGEQTVAEIELNILPKTASGTMLRIALESGTYTVKDDNDYQTTFAAKEITREIKSHYVLYADALVEGGSGQHIYVEDTAGNKAVGVSVYKADGTLLGKTGEKGTVKANKITSAVGNYQLYAEKDGEYSFITGVSVLASVGDKEGKPTQITSVAVKNPETTKTFTWFSNPDVADNEAILQVAAASDYEKDGVSAFKDYKGESKLHSFNGSSNPDKNVTGLLNKATASGLKSGVKYAYRVGDGNYWSDVNTFTLKRKGTSANLFIIGDAQSENTTNFDKVIGSIKASEVDYNLGIQTGDLVDAAGIYTNWVAGLNCFSKDSFTQSTDILHSIGNHEREGDQNLIAASQIFDMPDKQHYSVEYGNVYIATLSYAHSQVQLEEDLEWLKNDAKASKAQWKIVVTHQPAYYTNTAGSNELMHELLPAAAEEAGIDFVFSGHDHAYARTEPLKAGEVNKDDGIVYYICGSTGEKSYGITDNKDFHFAKLDGDFDAIYLTVKANDKEFKVETHELDGKVIDSYVKEAKTDCTEKGHSYIYDGEEDLTCENCDYTISIKDYTGFATDKSTDKKMHFINGVPQTGWAMLSNDVYYFNNKGLSENVVLVEDVETDCTVRGYKLYRCEKASSADGKDYKVDKVKAAGHEYNSKRVCSKCGWKETSLKDCNITTTYTKYKYTGKEIKPVVTVKCNGVTLKEGSHYKLSYIDNVKIGTKAKYRIVPITKYTGDKVNHRGSLAYGARNLYFTIAPAKPANLKSETLGLHTIKLKWDSSLGATGYQIYKLNSSTNKYKLYKTITSGKTTSYSVGNLTAGKSSKYKVRSYTKLDTQTVYSNYVYINAITKPSIVKNLSLSTKNKSITAKWGKVSYATGYQVYYDTSSKFNNYKKFTVKGNSDIDKTITKLTKGKRYYVKVRAYKSYSGCKTVYGSWSTTKSIVTK